METWFSSRILTKPLCMHHSVHQVLPKSLPTSDRWIATHPPWPWSCWLSVKQNWVKASQQAFWKQGLKAHTCFLPPLNGLLSPWPSISMTHIQWWLWWCIFSPQLLLSLILSRWTWLCWIHVQWWYSGCITNNLRTWKFTEYVGILHHARNLLDYSENCVGGRIASPLLKSSPWGITSGKQAWTDAAVDTTTIRHLTS